MKKGGSFLSLPVARARLITYVALVCLLSACGGGFAPNTVSLSGNGVNAHSATLSWTASTSTVAGYNVYRGTTSGGPYTKLNSSLVAGTTYTDNTVAAGQTHYYVVTAVDSSNIESVFSNQVQAVVPSP